MACLLAAFADLLGDRASNRCTSKFSGPSWTPHSQFESCTSNPLVECDVHSSRRVCFLDKVSQGSRMHASRAML